MTQKKVIPSIHVPIQKPDGSMEWAWYLYLQYLTSGADSLESLSDTDIKDPIEGDHLVYDGSTWKNTPSSASVSWGGITGSIENQTDLQNALNAKQNIINDLSLIRKGASMYVHEQAVASSVWTITHNLGKNPSIEVVDSSGKVVTGKYTYVDINTITAEFNSAFKGKAYLN